jgi:transposase
MACGNRRHISNEQKELVCVMSATMTNQEISKATGFSKRSIRRWLENWHNTGKVFKVACAQRGRPRTLNGIHMTVCSHILA